MEPQQPILSAQPQPTRRLRRLGWALLATALFLTAVIGGTGRFHVRREQAKAHRAAQEMLAAVADLKAAEIARWREERLADAVFIRWTPYAARRALDAMAQPDSATTRKMFNAWLKPLMGSRPYERALVLDDQLQVRLVQPEGASDLLSDSVRLNAGAALRSRQAGASDLYRDTADGPLRLSLMVPLVVRREGVRENVPAAGTGTSSADRSAGVLVLQANADRVLGPILKSWPTPSPSAETYLVRREADTAMFLNELRYGTNTALKLRIPLAETNVLAVRACLGQETLLQGRDYRGVESLAAAEAVLGTPWILVAKVDQAEIDAPLRRVATETALFVGLLMLTAILGVGLVWRQEVLVASQRELTERKRAEQSLAELARIINRSPTIAYLARATDGLPVEYVSENITQFGYTTADFTSGRFTYPSIIHPEDRERVLTEAERHIGAGATEFTQKYRVLAQSGAVRWVEDCTWLRQDAGGTTTHVEGVLADITARQQADQERAVMQMQLQQAQKLESVGRLAAGIAHEINTPTQFIGDNARFLQDAFTDLQPLLAKTQQWLAAARSGAVPPDLMAEVEAAIQTADIDYLTAEIPKALDQSLEGLARVTKIVRAMKEFSHPGTEAKSAADLNHAIESTTIICHNEWKYVADLVTDFDPALPAVPCLVGEFNQVILNLVINAAHAIADVVGDGGQGKGTITVRTRRDGDWVEVRVQDTGRGIPESVRHRMFEPFFTTKPVGEGTGQGLAIAHSVIVNKHSGTITFESAVGQGTTFIVRLPLHPPATAHDRLAA